MFEQVIGQVNHVTYIDGSVTVAVPGFQRSGLVSSFEQVIDHMHHVANIDNSVMFVISPLYIYGLDISGLNLVVVAFHYSHIES